MMRYAILIVALAFAPACSGSSPTGPTPPPVVPPVTPITLTVHVTATNGGQPLSGLSGDIGGQTASTNGEGSLQYQLSPGASARLSLTGSGIVPRSLTLAVSSSRDVSVDAISVGGFDLNFYRQFVRNTFDAPNGSEPLRRWTTNPSIYIQTAAIDAKTLDMVDRAARESVTLWTAGRFNVATVERGNGTREGQPGWLTVKWSAVNDGFCGTALVGGTSIELHPNSPRCACAGYSIEPTTVRHELGHAMGFWHTDNAGDVMSTSSGCDQQPSARERAAAAIAYSRPVGNTDPDQDPSGAVTLAPMMVR